MQPHKTPAQYLLWAIGTAALAVLLTLAAGKNAHAVGYQFSWNGGYCDTDQCTPLDAASSVMSQAIASCQVYHGAGNCAPAVKFGFRATAYGEGGWTVYLVKITNAPQPNQYHLSGVAYPRTAGGGNAGNVCWNAAWNAMSSDPIGFSGCQPCKDGLHYADGQCKVPECPEGQQWDENILACRATCPSGELFHYAKNECVKQCEAGKWVDGFATEFQENGEWYGNRLLNGEQSYLNGCKVEAESSCYPSAADDGRGLSCMHFFKYIENGQEDFEWQMANEGFEGLQPESGTAKIDGETVTLNPYVEGGLTPIVYGARGMKCVDGTLYEYVIAEGELHESRELGPCHAVGEDVAGTIENGFIAAAIDRNTAQLTETKTAVVELGDAETETQGLIAALGEQIEALANSVGGGGGGEPGGGGGDGPCEGEDCKIDGGDFPTEIDPDTVYQTRYGEGAGGIKEAIDNAQAIDADSDLTSFMESIQPDLSGIVAPECLSWTIDVIFLGEITFMPPCWIWDLLAVLLKLSAVLTAYSILYGKRAEGV